MSLVLPLSFLSRVMGFLARLELPRQIQERVNLLFCKLTKIDLSEALHAEAHHYPSLEALFTRTLKPNARPIKGLFVSPADGVVNVSKSANGGDQALQFKELTFSLKELAQSHESYAWYATIYLAPHNYHRVHAPASGTLREIIYVPGALFPVNRYCTSRVRGLYVQNERLIFKFSSAAGNWDVIMVGALNVGRMTTPFLANFATNDALFKRKRSIPLGADVRCGDEIGTFMLGSTVVIAMDRAASEAFRPFEISLPTPIQMGTRLGA